MVYFGDHRPRTPIPSEGRIYAFDNHGTIVYLTKYESLLTQDLWVYYVALGLLIIVVVNKRGWDRD